MNHVYSVLWNALLGRFCVASELGRQRNRCVKRDSRGASRGMSSLRPTALAALCALMGSGPGWAVTVSLPEGATAKHGDFNQRKSLKGDGLLITQTSPRAILEWNKFEIGQGHRVTFKQPNINSVALNRVVGEASSQILGSLQANGRVFLVNPNGVVFGKDASVDVGSLVASTLDITDENFLADIYQFQGLARGINNSGNIKAADGGAIVLLGGVVENSGTVIAKRGKVVLAAGTKVVLGFGKDNRLEVAVDESTLNAEVSNHGSLIADGGDVWMAARTADGLLQTVINNTGHIQARTMEKRRGIIRLWGGGSGGSMQIWGSLDVSAELGDAGGLSIRGRHVQVDAGTQVELSAPRGNGGLLQVSATKGDLSVVNADSAWPFSRIDASVLNAALKQGEVHLNSDKGDIRVDAPVNWQQNRLQLNAQRNIDVNSVMTASGTAALELNHGGHDAVTGAPATRAHSGVNMAMSNDGFTGRVDFEDVLDQSAKSNRRLTINGESYALLTKVASHPLHASGRGDAATNSAAQPLQNIKDLKGNYAMAADVSLEEGNMFQPLGSASKPFTGKLDGLGHKITNLNIGPGLTSGEHVALLGVSEGSLRNLELDGGKSSVNRSPGSGVHVASFVGELRDGGSIANVRSSVEVRAASESATAGGLVGKMAGGAVSNAHAYGPVTAKALGVGVNASSMAGGIAGEVQRGSITDTTARTTVTSSAYAINLKGKPPVQALSFVGGGIGSNADGFFANVTFAGEVRDESVGKTRVSIDDAIGNDHSARLGEAKHLRAVQQATGFGDLFIIPGDFPDMAPAGMNPVENVPGAPGLAAMPANAMVEAAALRVDSPVIAPVKLSIPTAQTSSPEMGPIDLSPRAPSRPATPLNAAITSTPARDASPVTAANGISAPATPIPSPAMDALELPARAASQPATPISAAVEAAPARDASPVTAPAPATPIPSPAMNALELPARAASQPAAPISAAVGVAPARDASPVTAPAPAPAIPSPAMDAPELPARAASLPATPTNVAVEAAPLTRATPAISADEISVPALPLVSPLNDAMQPAPAGLLAPVSAALQVTAQPIDKDASGRAQAAVGQPAPSAPGEDPLLELQSLPGYAAAKATIGSMTRRAPPPAAEPAVQELPYTVIDGGVRLPLR